MRGHIPWGVERWEGTRAEERAGGEDPGLAPEGWTGGQGRESLEPGNQLSPPGENQTATEQGPGRGSEKGTSQDKGDVQRGEALVPRVRHTSHIQERSPLLISAGPEGPVCGNLVHGPGNTGTPGLCFEDGEAAGKWDFNAQRLCVCGT